MSNTVITNYTDLNGPSSKADSSVVVIVNKDGSLSVDQNLLGTLMGTDGSQSAGISVVRVGHEGRPDDATDSETEDDKIPHVTLSVDSYYGEPNSIIKYDSGAEMLQSLRIETRENSLVGFQNDHCYTPLTSPNQGTPQRSENFCAFDEPVIEITHTPPPKPVPQSKKITILDQQVIPKGKKVLINPSESSVLLKGKDNKQLPAASKTKQSELEPISDNTESSSISSGESIPDRDSDSDYNDTRDRSLRNVRKSKLSKPRILKHAIPKSSKADLKHGTKHKFSKSLTKKDIGEKILRKGIPERKQSDPDVTASKESLETPATAPIPEIGKVVTKPTPKPVKKEKKPPAHMTALLSDMTSLFSTPDVIRRVSSDGKMSTKPEEPPQTPKKATSILKPQEAMNSKLPESQKQIDAKPKTPQHKTLLKSNQPKPSPAEKVTKGYDLIPQLDDAALAQILQDTTGITTSSSKPQPSISTVNTMSSPGLAGPISPTLDLLGGLQEEGLTEDLLMHVAQLVESSENLQEVIDKQVLGKVDTAPAKAPVQSPFQQQQAPAASYSQTPTKASSKTIQPRKDPIEIVRRDGRVITLPPIEAPATRSSKRKSQVEPAPAADPAAPAPAPAAPALPAPSAPAPAPGPAPPPAGRQYINKKLPPKRQDQPAPPAVADKVSAESQESWNSEDDPYRLWCICKQPHNNRFMICCDGCEDWFHGKCVNITKAMGQQMEEQGIEWRCPNCVKKTKSATKPQTKVIVFERKTGRLLAGPNAPTAENLKTWLQKNPTFEVVRPGTLHTIKPNLIKRKSASEAGKIQTTLNFERIPRKSDPQPGGSKAQQQGEARAGVRPPQPAPVRARPADSPRAGPSAAGPPPAAAPTTPARAAPATPARPATEPKKPARLTATRSHSVHEKAVSASPARRKDAPEPRRKMDSSEPIRDNVRKSLTEQMTSRLRETRGAALAVGEVDKFAADTERELYELFGRDVGIKYKAKYRSLMFNIKDRKNLSLWQKICDRKITPAQLVRLSPEEMASQELAQWREDETKHQLELIKKSELDLLAASKTYVLKTHKGEEVMEKKDSVQTELDPEVPVEDVVVALNDSTVGEQVTNELLLDKSDAKPATKGESKKKDKDKEKRSSRHSKRSRRESRRDSDGKRSRRRSDERSSRRHKSGHARSPSPTRDRKERDKTDSGERTRRRSRSRSRPRRRSRSRSRARPRRRSPSPAARTPSPAPRSPPARRRSARHHKDPAPAPAPAPATPVDKPRARSQEPADTKSKNDSTDSDSVERPKSASLREAHPEYDPHEAMITSAFSEEDLRRAGADSPGYPYGADGVSDLPLPDEYDPTQAFAIDTSVTLPAPSFITKHDKTSEAESDQEPSSTVESSAAVVWNGCINMVDVARFYVAAHEVSGYGADLEEDLSAELDIVGRINPDTVWDYIGKMKRTSNKDIVVLRLHAANDEERMQYIALYSYLSTRNRLGVVKVANTTTTVKDFYIVPLAANSAPHAVLLPLQGAGLHDNRTHLLLAIVIRQRKKRAAPAPLPHPAPAKVARERGARKRSYTPPLAGRAGSPPAAAGPARHPPPPAYTSPALSTSVKDKIAASLAAADDDEPYSPGSSSSSGSAPAVPPHPALPAPPTDKLRCKMEELNRQIEEQKQQILKMAQADSSVGEDEAYSPSRPMTPPDAPAAPSGVPLADIALPSNLHEILATIKQRSEPAPPAPAPAPPAPAPDVDMRNLPLPP